MTFEVLTIFPQFFEAYFNTGVLKKANERSVNTGRLTTILTVEVPGWYSWLNRS
jgi:tRNA G37 N-methylase TrmD